MTQKMKTGLGIAGLILLIGIAAIAYNTLGKQANQKDDIRLARAQGDTSDSGEMQKAPDFGMINQNGDSVKLSGFTANGKPIVLNFWASWCPPCKMEMPDFNRVYLDIGDEVQFMMVDLIDGQRETVETGTKYINDNNFSFPVFFDTRQEGAYAYGIRSIPTTLFINGDGYIVTMAQGAINESTLRRGIELIR